MDAASNAPSPPSGYRFLSKRLFATAGYLSVPTVYDAMLFYLPPISSVTTRVVRFKNRLLELWSPNSKTHAFYPGISKEDAVFGTELESTLRRSDGHLGRFDYTKNPQLFSLQRPWLGFIKAPQNDSSPENIGIHDVWTPTSPPNYGYLQYQYITRTSLLFNRLLTTARNLEIPLIRFTEPVSKCPPHLSTNSSDTLKGIKTLDEAVDQLATVQRDLKELDAWNRMTESLRLDAVSVEIVPGIPEADESLLGVWLNGCDETNGNWLLKNRVPCFLVHEADGDDDWNRLAQQPVQCVTPIARTPVISMDNKARSYERRFLENGQIFDSLEEDLGIALYRDIPRSMRTDRICSSSYGQGWKEGTYINPRGTTVSDPIQTQAYTEKDGKIIPPAVQMVLPGEPWTLWIQDTLDDGTECIRKRGHAYKGDKGRHQYFDRANKRHICLDESLSVPCHYDADHRIYGIPGPTLPFLSSKNDRDFKSHFASPWVYKRRDPLKGEAGMEYVPKIPNGPPPVACDYSSGSSISLGSDDDDIPTASKVALYEASSEIVVRNNFESSNQALESTVNASKDYEMNGPSSILTEPRGMKKDTFEGRGGNNYGRSTGYDGQRRGNNWAYHSRNDLRYVPAERRRQDSHRANPRHYSPSPRRHEYARRSPSPPPRRVTYSPLRHRSRSPPGRRSRSPHRYRSRSPRHRSRSPPRRYSRSPPPCGRCRSPLRRRSRSPSCRNRSYSPRRIGQPSSLSNFRDPFESSQNPTPTSSMLTRNRQEAHSPPTTLTLMDARPNSSEKRKSYSPPSDSLEPDRRALISRISTFAEERRASLPIAGPSNNSLSRPNAFPERVVSMFTTVEESPVETDEYISQGISRFLVIWNFMVLHCWDDVLEWITATAQNCRKVKLVQVMRTNEMGHQVFWLAFKQADHAESFRGRVASRYTDSDHLVRCDFVTPAGYSMVAGRCTDRWDSAKGLLMGRSSSEAFPNDSNGRLSLPGLAARLGITNLPPSIVGKPKNRRKNRKGNHVRLYAKTTDGGAL